MPNPGPAYPVDAAWRAAVIETMRRKGMSKAELSREAKCSKTTITQLLGGVLSQSTVVPAVHAAIGWPPPMAPLASVDGPEISAIFDRLDEQSRAMLMERARTLLELQKK